MKAEDAPAQNASRRDRYASARRRGDMVNIMFIDVVRCKSELCRQEVISFDDVNSQHAMRGLSQSILPTHTKSNAVGCERMTTD